MKKPADEKVMQSVTEQDTIFKGMVQRSNKRIIFLIIIFNLVRKQESMTIRRK